MIAAMNSPLNGKVALITGASREIGLTIAERLGHDGALCPEQNSSPLGRCDDLICATP
jgi:hypothetical protein